MQIPCQEWTMLDLLPKGKISFRGFWEEKMLFRLVFSFAFATWTLTFQAKRNITTSPKHCKYMTFPRCRRFVLGILVKIGKVDEVNDVEPIRVPIASGTRAGDYWQSDGLCGLPRHNVVKICRIKISHHIKELRTTYKYFRGYRTWSRLSWFVSQIELWTTFIYLVMDERCQDTVLLGWYKSDQDCLVCVCVRSRSLDRGFTCSYCP